MNISVYLEETLIQKIDKFGQRENISRSKIIKEALMDWVAIKERSKWRKGFFDFKGDENFPSVEEIRKTQKEQFRDPFES